MNSFKNSLTLSVLNDCISLTKSPSNFPSRILFTTYYHAYKKSYYEKKKSMTESCGILFIGFLKT